MRSQSFNVYLQDQNPTVATFAQKRFESRGWSDKAKAWQTAAAAAAVDVLFTLIQDLIAVPSAL